MKSNNYTQSPMTYADSVVKPVSNIHVTGDGESNSAEGVGESFSDSGYEFSSFLASFTSGKESSAEWSCTSEGGKSDGSFSPCYERKTPKISILPFVKPKVLFPSPDSLMSFEELNEISKDFKLKERNSKSKLVHLSLANEVAQNLCKESSIFQIQAQLTVTEQTSASVSEASEGRTSSIALPQLPPVQFEEISKQENCYLKPPFVPLKTVKTISQAKPHKKRKYVKKLFTEDSNVQNEVSRVQISDTCVQGNRDRPSPSMGIGNVVNDDMTDWADQKLAGAADIAGTFNPLKRNVGSRKNKFTRAKTDENKETTVKLCQPIAQAHNINKRAPFSQLDKNLRVKANSNDNIM